MLFAIPTALNLYLSRVWCNARVRIKLAIFPHRLITSTDIVNRIVNEVCKTRMQNASVRSCIIEHAAEDLDPTKLLVCGGVHLGKTHFDANDMQRCKDHYAVYPKSERRICPELAFDVGCIGMRQKRCPTIRNFTTSMRYFLCWSSDLIQLMTIIPPWSTTKLCYY